MNFVSLLGWTPVDPTKEIFDYPTLIEEVSLKNGKELSLRNFSFH
jgi:hypothetical protein